MLKFIVDTQLPPSLSQKLILDGFDSIHTTSFENGHLMNDKTIRHIAVTENRIVITKDTDFLDYFILRGAPPQVLLIELGNISNSRLFAIFNSNIEQIKKLFEKEKVSLVLLQKNNAFAY